MFRPRVRHAVRAASPRPASGSQRPRRWSPRVARGNNPSSPCCTAYRHRGVRWLVRRSHRSSLL